MCSRKRKKNAVTRRCVTRCNYENTAREHVKVVVVVDERFRRFRNTRARTYDSCSCDATFAYYKTEITRFSAANLYGKRCFLLASNSKKPPPTHTFYYKGLRARNFILGEPPKNVLRVFENFVREQFFSCRTGEELFVGVYVRYFLPVAMRLSKWFSRNLRTRAFLSV